MQCQMRPLLSARRHLVLAVSFSARPSPLPRFLSTTPSNDPHPILSELQRKGATSPSSSTTSGPHLGPFPLPNIDADSADSAQARQARIDASSRQWSKLGVAQKAGVVATQGASLVVVLAGAGLFALVAYAFGSELFSEASPTRVFEDCVERVKQDHELPTMLAPPYSFHGPVSPADARLRRNHRRPSHTLTVDPSTGVETLYVRFAITASDPLASSDLEASQGNNVIARSWDWAKTWIGPLVWDDSHHPGAYDPKLSNGLTASQLEQERERERQHREQVERSERQRASWTGWAANGLGNFVGTVVGSSLGGLRNLSGMNAKAAPGGGGEGYFRRPRKPAYGEYTSAEVVAELQKDPKTGHFVYKQLFAAIPDTRASNYYRHDIPTATIVPPSADQEGQQPNRWRFWNRQKTVVA